MMVWPDRILCFIFIVLTQPFFLVIVVPETPSTNEALAANDTYAVEAAIVVPPEQPEPPSIETTHTPETVLILDYPLSLASLSPNDIEFSTLVIVPMPPPSDHGVDVETGTRTNRDTLEWPDREQSSMISNRKRRILLLMLEILGSTNALSFVYITLRFALLQRLSRSEVNDIGIGFRDQWNVITLLSERLSFHLTFYFFLERITLTLIFFTWLGGTSGWIVSFIIGAKGSCMLFHPFVLFALAWLCSILAMIASAFIFVFLLSNILRFNSSFHNNGFTRLHRFAISLFATLFVINPIGGGVASVFAGSDFWKGSLYGFYYGTGMWVLMHLHHASMDGSRLVQFGVTLNCNTILLLCAFCLPAFTVTIMSSGLESSTSRDDFALIIAKFFLGITQMGQLTPIISSLPRSCN